MTGRVIKVKLNDSSQKKLIHGNVFAVSKTDDFLLINTGFVGSVFANTQNADSIEVDCNAEILIPASQIDNFCGTILNVLIQDKTYSGEMTVSEIVNRKLNAQREDESR